MQWSSGSVLLDCAVTKKARSSNGRTKSPKMMETREIFFMDIRSGPFGMVLDLSPLPRNHAEYPRFSMTTLKESGGCLDPSTRLCDERETSCGEKDHYFVQYLILREKVSNLCNSTQRYQSILGWVKKLIIPGGSGGTLNAQRRMHTYYILATSSAWCLYSREYVVSSRPLQGRKPNSE